MSVSSDDINISDDEYVSDEASDELPQVPLNLNAPENVNVENSQNVTVGNIVNMTLNVQNMVVKNDKMNQIDASYPAALSGTDFRLLLGRMVSEAVAETVPKYIKEKSSSFAAIESNENHGQLSQQPIMKAIKYETNKTFEPGIKKIISKCINLEESSSNEILVLDENMKTIKCEATETFDPGIKKVISKCANMEKPVSPLEDNQQKIEVNSNSSSLETSSIMEFPGGESAMQKILREFFIKYNNKELPFISNEPSTSKENTNNQNRDLCLPEINDATINKPPTKLKFANNSHLIHLKSVDYLNLNSKEVSIDPIIYNDTKDFSNYFATCFISDIIDFIIANENSSLKLTDIEEMLYHDTGNLLCERIHVACKNGYLEDCSTIEISNIDYFNLVNDSLIFNFKVTFHKLEFHFKKCNIFLEDCLPGAFVYTTDGSVSTLINNNLIDVHLAAVQNNDGLVIICNTDVREFNSFDVKFICETDNEDLEEYNKLSINYTENYLSSGYSIVLSEFILKKLDYFIEKAIQDGRLIREILGKLLMKRM